MNVFEEREKAFEAKYHIDEELAFKVNARRDKLLGLWVAEKLGLQGDAAEAYALSVLDADFADPGHVGMMKKLIDDLAAKNIVLEEDRLLRQMDHLLITAREQLMQDLSSGKVGITPA